MRSKFHHIKIWKLKFQNRYRYMWNQMAKWTWRLSRWTFCTHQMVSKIYLQNKMYKIYLIIDEYLNSLKFRKKEVTIVHWKFKHSPPRPLGSDAHVIRVIKTSCIWCKKWKYDCTLVIFFGLAESFNAAWFKMRDHYMYVINPLMVHIKKIINNN